MIFLIGLLGIFITVMVLTFQHVGQPKFHANALMYNNNNNDKTLMHNCSNGWNITGYFTPIEQDYVSLPKKIISVQGVGNIAFNTEFLTDVITEGWGKTNLGWYVGSYDNAWHKSYGPLSANGQRLTIGMVATDPRVIPTNGSLSITTLPYPWNLRTFVATDTAPAVTGKHIDVYTGEGKVAQTKTLKITGQGKMVCFALEPNIINNNSRSVPPFVNFLR